MPSKRSWSSTLATGRATGVGATEPVPHFTGALTDDSCVSAKLSPAVPRTRTISPALTLSTPAPLKTKIPSEVSGSVSTSAASSWR